MITPAPAGGSLNPRASKTEFAEAPNAELAEEAETAFIEREPITVILSEKGWIRALKGNKGIKFKQVYVQHLDGAVTKGQAAIYFFPMGSSEKAIVELTDGTDTFSVLVYGLTGRVELKDGALKNVDDHMLRNAIGDKDAKRDGAE